MRLRCIRFDGNRPAVGVRGPTRFTALFQRNAQIHERVRVSGMKLQRRVAGRQRLLVPTEVEQCLRKILVCGKQRRLPLKRTTITRDSLVRPTTSGQGDAKVIHGLGVVGPAGEHPAVAVNGLPETLVSGQCRAEVVPGVEVIRFETQRLAQRRDGFDVSTL